MVFINQFDIENFNYKIYVNYFSAYTTECALYCVRICIYTFVYYIKHGQFYI